MAEPLLFQQTVLAELAHLHATLATLEDFVISTAGGAAEDRKRQLVRRIQQLARQRLQQLCQRAGVECPPE